MYKKKISFKLNTPVSLIQSVDQKLSENRNVRSLVTITNILFNVFRRYVQKKGQKEEKYLIALKCVNFIVINKKEN